MSRPSLKTISDHRPVNQNQEKNGTNNKMNLNSHKIAFASYVLALLVVFLVDPPNNLFDSIHSINNIFK